VSLIALRVFYGTIFDTQGTGANTVKCHVDDFKRSSEMDVSNDNTMGNLPLPRSGAVVPGLSAVSHALVWMTPEMEFQEPPFWQVQVWADESILSSSRAGLWPLHLCWEIKRVRMVDTRNFWYIGLQGSCSAPPWRSS
jgi:hypothetical protein